MLQASTTGVATGSSGSSAVGVSARIPRARRSAKYSIPGITSSSEPPLASGGGHHDGERRGVLGRVAGERHLTDVLRIGEGGERRRTIVEHVGVDGDGDDAVVAGDPLGVAPAQLRWHVVPHRRLVRSPRRRLDRPHVHRRGDVEHVGHVLGAGLGLDGGELVGRRRVRSLHLGGHVGVGALEGGDDVVVVHPVRRQSDQVDAPLGPGRLVQRVELVTGDVEGGRARRRRRRCRCCSAPSCRAGWSRRPSRPRVRRGRRAS